MLWCYFHSCHRLTIPQWSWTWGVVLRDPKLIGQTQNDGYRKAYWFNVRIFLNVSVIFWCSFFVCLTHGIPSRFDISSRSPFQIYIHQITEDFWEDFQATTSTYLWVATPLYPFINKLNMPGRANEVVKLVWWGNNIETRIYPLVN